MKWWELALPNCSGFPQNALLHWEALAASHLHTSYHRLGPGIGALTPMAELCWLYLVPPSSGSVWFLSLEK